MKYLQIRVTTMYQRTCIFPLVLSGISSSLVLFIKKMYTPGTIANSQTEREPTKINKNGAALKIYKNFSGTRDALRY